MDGISKGVLASTKPDENYETKVSNVARNVSNYIKLREAGHKKYGMSYLLAQVSTQRNFCSESQNLSYFCRV